MKALLLVLATFLSVSFVSDANAVVCAKGVVKAGCAGPNGAAVVTKPVPRPVTGARVHRRP
jgi:hypothetical protein